MRGLVVVALLSSGCIHPDLIDCTEDLQCPQGTVCLADQHTCVDPRGLELPDGTLDFTTVACGASSQLAVPLSNHGITPVSFSARTTLSPFSVEPAQGTVDPGSAVDLVITAMPGAVAAPGETIEGALEVATFAGVMERRVSFVPTGGLAHVADTLDFGELPLGDSAQAPLVIENAGTAPFGVSFDLHSTVFDIVGAVTTAVIAPQSSQMLTIDYAPPTLQSSSANVALDYDRALCEAPPASVQLTGKSSGDPLLASLQKLDFGDSPCHAPEEIQNVTITNNDSVEQTLTVNIEQESEWFSVPPGLRVVPPGGTTTFSVTRLPTQDVAKPEELKSHSAALRISASPAQFSKDVALQWELRAPLLKLETDKLDLNDVNGSVGVINLGNTVAPVLVTPSTQSMNGITVQFIDQLQLAPGVSDKVNARLFAVAPNALFSAVYNVSAAGNCTGSIPLAVTAASAKATPPPSPD